MSDEPAGIPPLSPEFLTGNTEKGLEKIRTRLLDLTTRNRLLNFRHSSATSLRIVGAYPDGVFRRLLDGEKLTFLPVPEPAEYAGQKPSAVDYATSLGWPTAFDLDTVDQTADRPTLAVLHYGEQFETLTRKIGSAAKTAVEESGANMLYLVIGFLEWYESDDSQQPRLAPLLTVPVLLDRSAGRGAGFQCAIEYSGEDLGTNLSLVERMRRDFTLEVPAFESDETATEYFTKFQPIFRQKRRWCIRRQISLTLLSFGKLLMYRDLDPSSWPGIITHPYGSATHAEEFEIDSPELKNELPPLILDADSSQHSALVHALRGQNMVIEGPPGTGKSQTITNLIGAALAKGKTVLFVAEKLAALEVVRKRLDEAGLGIFCLELHSHKTKKHALLTDIESRIKARGSFRHPREMDSVLAVLEEKKLFLTRYVGEINRRIQPFDVTVFEILWARDRYRQELPFDRELMGNVPNALTLTRAQYAQMESFLDVYAQHLAAVLKVSPDLDKHPWAWLEKNLSFEQEERTVNLLTDLMSTIDQKCSYAEPLAAECGVVLGKQGDEAEEATALLNLLPKELPTCDLGVLSTCSAPEAAAQTREFIQCVKSARGAVENLQELVHDTDNFLAGSSLESISEAFESLRTSEMADHTAAEIEQVVLAARASLQKLNEIRQSVVVLATLLECDATLDISFIESLVNCLRLLEDAPVDVLHLRSKALEGDGIPTLLNEAIEEAEAIGACHRDLDAVFDLETAAQQDSLELINHAKSLENASLFEALFGSGVRRAKRIHARFAKYRRKASREELARELRKLAEYLQRNARFEKDARYQNTFGHQFRGRHTKWNDLRKIVYWYRQVFTTLPEHTRRADQLRNLLLTGRTEHLKALRSELPGRTKERTAVLSASSLIETLAQTFPSARGPNLSDALSSIQAIVASMEAAVRQISAAQYKNDVSISRIPKAVQAVARYQAAVAEISGKHAICQSLGNSFRGIETDLEPIEGSIAYADRINRCALKGSAGTWLISNDQRQRLQNVRDWLSGTITTLGTYRDHLRELADLTESPLWSSDHKTPMLLCAQMCRSSLDSRDTLPQWVHFLRVRQESIQHGLSKLTALADRHEMEPAHLVPAFRFLFYDSLARGIFAESRDLSGLTGLTVSEIRKQFAKFDHQAIALHRQRASSIVDQRPVPSGSQTGPVGAWTDFALVMHEINKQRRHIPIRQLMRRAGRALQALKPCFMMSPLSVAQYLAPGELTFDLIVMDEASQLKPEDAVGALARGGQMIIVGDPKQLPPTTFFQRAATDAETEEDEQSRTVAEEGESILDVASTLYQPVRRLRWHYRSRHHSLIAFSNKEFYQGDLVIFPSAYHERDDLGVKYHGVSGGVFDSGRNAREAAVVVEAVIDHMERKSDESLGVVSLNFEQGELIEELLDHRLATEPFAVSYEEKMNSVSEPFFVKNLENVQGDERDVIFISATYGPDSKGNQYQRFGPINGPNGHRRLNVLFTRAKKRTEVFSSLDPDKIQVGPGSAWGLRALKQYLIFARSGILDTPDSDADQPTNDFERSVGTILKEKNYEVVPQVGVAGFFIDLAVKHPTKPGSYVLGIECDGASYHSGRSARDRDRLREEILVNLGWTIHRIWSTDWFKNRNGESERLLKRLDEILAADPDYQKEKTKQAREEALRYSLLDLRNVIRREFPDSPYESCLLRDEMLDELMFRRPTSKDTWFRLIPQALRASTDSKQVSRYLIQVLQIIADTGS